MDFWTIKLDTLGQDNTKRLKIYLTAVLKTLDKDPGETILFGIDELDSAFKVQIGHSAWSPPIFGTIEKGQL